MEPYANKSGKSGIAAYENGADYILVKFISGETYRYTYRSAGKRAIEAMKQFASAGKGLSTFISQTIKQQYENRL